LGRSTRHAKPDPFKAHSLIGRPFYRVARIEQWCVFPEMLAKSPVLSALLGTEYEYWLRALSCTIHAPSEFPNKKPRGFSASGLIDY
jgi:hypothetical protein